MRIVPFAECDSHRTVGSPRISARQTARCSHPTSGTASHTSVLQSKHSPLPVRSPSFRNDLGSASSVLETGFRLAGPTCGNARTPHQTWGPRHRPRCQKLPNRYIYFLARFRTSNVVRARSSGLPYTVHPQAADLRKWGISARQRACRVGFFNARRRVGWCYLNRRAVGRPMREPVPALIEIRGASRGSDEVTIPDTQRSGYG